MARTIGPAGDPDWSGSRPTTRIRAFAGCDRSKVTVTTVGVVGYCGPSSCRAATYVTTRRWSTVWKATWVGNQAPVGAGVGDALEQDRGHRVVSRQARTNGIGRGLGDTEGDRGESEDPEDGTHHEGDGAAPVCAEVDLFGLTVHQRAAESGGCEIRWYRAGIGPEGGLAGSSVLGRNPGRHRLRRRVLGFGGPVPDERRRLSAGHPTLGVAAEGVGSPAFRRARCVRPGG